MDHFKTREPVDPKLQVALMKRYAYPVPFRGGLTPASFDYMGQTDAQQDTCENYPFSSVGGTSKRTAMTAPSWIDWHQPELQSAYLEGYRKAALKMYGPDWQTCESIQHEG
jgi:hypothetical protein